MDAWLSQQGILRSLVIYYGRPWQKRRLRQLYAPFVTPGALCFDIGAHVGNRIQTWTALGARVVAVEPQPRCMHLLRRWYGSRTEVTLVEAALGAQPGQATLHVSRATPTVSTLATDWIATVRQDASFAGVAWDETVTVPVLTLDQLIARHGIPAFCKIDVEGYEGAVLRGLSQPLPALSFEYLPAALERAQDCLNRLAALGDYRYNWSRGESHRLRAAHWLTGTDLLTALPQLASAGSGDIYARLSA